MSVGHPPHLRHHHHWLPENISLMHNTSTSTTDAYTYSFTDSALLWNDSYNLTESTPVVNGSRSGVDPVVFIYASSFLIVFCTVSLAVNVVILSSVCFMRSRIYPTLYISLSLAGADTFSLFFYALGLLFFTLLPRLGVRFDTPCAMLMLEALRMGAIMTTLFHLAALAGNHYLGILLPLHYPVYMARRNIQYCIIVLWTIPSSLLVLDMFFLEGDGFKMCPYHFLKRSKFRTRFSIPFFTTLGMMIFIYLHIYKLVCKHQKQPLNGKYQGRRCYTRRSGGFSSSQVNEKAIITTLMILGSTIFGWAPAFTYYALFCEDCLFADYWNLQTPGELAVLLVINFLMICKTATNSYIYAFRMKEIKIALRRMRRRLLMCLFTNQIDFDQSDWTAGGLTRTTSRQSTSRSRTFVYRMNSLQDSHVNNGVAKLSPVDPSMRRCRSANFTRNKRCNTSV
ncbi:melanocyte-stimulating hormone receptor-like [Macrosteles quadrilineatus]|uniref:melanocyte-stimulating hormone receptor-like n=1 Tax=Macrosteles quadrilineatus TaxID=74068 RepID=UPI0023E2215A|nr:melanocyte-stimulating hormone receptor-like [Macrosteles quadrilineatus]